MSPEVDVDSEPRRDTWNLLSEVKGVKEEQLGVSLTSLLEQTQLNLYLPRQTRQSPSLERNRT